MSLSRDRMIDLMAYADGELEGAELARVEAMLAESEEAKRVVDSMRSLGDEVRNAEDAHGPRIDLADSIADAVMAKIDRGEVKDAQAPHADPVMGELVSLAERRKAMRARMTMAGAAMAAIAASVFFFMHTNEQGVGPVADNAPHETAPVVQPAPSDSSAAPAPPGDLPSAIANAATEVDLEEIESSEHRVSVFYVPKAAAASPPSVVIWIDDHAATKTK